MSASYHCLMFGLLAVVYHLWSSEGETYGTKTLEYTFIFIITLSHFLVLTWVSYKIAVKIKTRFCSERQMMQTVMQEVMNCFSRRKSYGYQQLSLKILCQVFFTFTFTNNKHRVLDLCFYNFRVLLHNTK